MSKNTNHASCSLPGDRVHIDSTLADSSPSDGPEELRQEWDKRLAFLKEPGAGDRLSSVMRFPGKLDGKVFAGAGLQDQECDDSHTRWP